MQHNGEPLLTPSLPSLPRKSAAPFLVPHQRFPTRASKVADILSKKLSLTVDESGDDSTSMRQKVEGFLLADELALQRLEHHGQLLDERLLWSRYTDKEFGEIRGICGGKTGVN